MTIILHPLTEQDYHYMIEDWEALLKKCDVGSNFDEEEILSEQELLSFESLHGFILPTAYKEYCQAFGTGCLEHGPVDIAIYCPETYSWESSQGWVKTTIEIIQTKPSGISEFDQQLLKILDLAFVFCWDDGAYCGFFDLSTYNISDQSCDIYWASIDVDSNSEIRKIGRNFFEFIQDYCLGEKFTQLFLEDQLTRWIEQHGTTKTSIAYFTPFNPSSFIN